MAWHDEFFEIVRENEPLAPRCWLRMGGAAEFFAEPRDEDQLVALIRRCREEDVPVRVLGGGSNLLIRDEGVPGVVLSLGAPVFQEISADGARLIAGGGARLGHVISHSVGAGLAGLENLVGVPGMVGGALHGNAGGRGGDIGQWTHAATVLTRAGEIHQRGRDDLVFSYRESSLDELVILRAEFRLEEEDPDELTRRMQKQWIVKKAEQPLASQNCACVFRNPRGMTAALLVDQAGLKGTRIGGAEVSDRNANFIVADDGATSADVLRLIDLMRGRVAERLGVELELALEVW